MFDGLLEEELENKRGRVKGIRGEGGGGGGGGGGGELVVCNGDGIKPCYKLDRL